MKYSLVIIAWLWVLASASWGAEVIPPRPTAYCNDYAHVLSPAAASQINSQLADFERASSDQLVVAIFPTMQSDSSLEDYTSRVAEAWRVGQKERNNGAVLFLFIKERRMRIEVGYGLEPVLTDALCKQIIEFIIKPHLQQGDYDGGIRAGVTAMMAAARGEFKGTGRTVAQGQATTAAKVVIISFVVLMFLLAILTRLLRGQGTVYRRGGYQTWGAGWWGGGPGGWSGGGGGSSGTDSFSGGGGSFGGGGASGSW